MPVFRGFQANPQRQTSLPDAFFSDLLPQMDHLGELKVTLFVFWYASQQEGDLRFVRKSTLAADKSLLDGLAKTGRTALAALDESLERAVLRGTLLAAHHTTPQGETESLYFIHSPRGQAALDALAAGRWNPDDIAQTFITPAQQRPNIFQLYESHIGPLTPMLAETLQDAEAEYPAGWIEEAIQIAVERNIRNWRYIEAILRGWKEKGRDERKNGEDSQKSQLDYFNQLAKKLEKRRK